MWAEAGGVFADVAPVRNAINDRLLVGCLSGKYIDGEMRNSLIVFKGNEIERKDRKIKAMNLFFFG